MPVELIPDPSPDSAEPVLRSKINEVIQAINALETAISTNAQVRIMWMNYRPDTDEVLAQSGGLNIVSNAGFAVVVGFDVPFDSEDDYAVVAMCTNVSGNAAGGGFAQITGHAEDEFTVHFNSDDGNSGTPSMVNIIVAYNATV